MKNVRPLIFSFLFCSAVIALSVLGSKQHCSDGAKKTISVVALAPSMQHKQTAIARSATASKVPLSRLLEPSPLNQLSPEEHREFPGAVVAEAIEIDGPEPGQKTRLRILNTDFKYPNIRTEEIIDAKNNSVVMRQEMVANHFLVTLAPGEDPEIFLKKMGSQVTSMERVTENALLYRVELAASSLEALPTALSTSALKTTGTSEPDIIIHGCTIPNDQNFSYQKELLNYHSYHGIDAVNAWNIRTDASAVIVAVLDSGIRYTHQDLAANIWNNPHPNRGDLHGCDAYNHDDPLDTFGHGTMCAGIIGAVGNNHIGISGVAWKVQLMACKFLSAGAGSTSDEIACIDYATNHGAKILNCSFGYPGPNYSFGELHAFERARAAGVIAVCSAGNGDQFSHGINNDTMPLFPASYKLDNIVSVAATDTHNNLASFSNYGAKSVHLAAPGTWIFSTYGGPGSDFESTNDFYYIEGTGDSSYAYMNGTSAAAPFVTGTFALLMAQFPHEPYNSLIARLLAATDKLPSLQRKTISGGFLNVYQALTSSFTPLPPSVPWYEYDSNRTWIKWLNSL